MKKIIALVLVLCMCFGMIVSVSAASPFAKRLNLVRLIRAMFASDDEDYGIGEVKDDVLTVYVAPNGKKGADGTAKNPTTLEAARDEVRGISKSGLNGIDIVLAAGEYVLSETFTLTAEDAGTKACPVRYIGEDGATVIGGVALTAKDFTSATGDAVQYFAEDVKANIVQYDLKQLGITAEDIQQDFASRHYNGVAVRLFSNGEMQTVARYPNEGEDQIIIQYGECIHEDGRERDWIDVMTVGVSDEVIERIRSWHTFEGAFISGYTDFLWRISNTYVTGVSEDKPEFYCPFPGTGTPRAGLEFYMYNIPEELDTPGEYYIDRDAILYYYPTEDFDTATLSVPIVDAIFDITDADYTTLENLIIETSARNGINAKADNITIYDCVIRGMVRSAIDIEGYNNTVSSCHIYDTGDTGTTMTGGDEATLTNGNNLFTNNYCHDFGLLSRGYSGALTLTGCGNTASHNEVFNGEHVGIHWYGTRNVLEYNYIHDVCQLVDDMGAIYGGGVNMIDCTARYNYIQNVGLPLGHHLLKLDDYIYCGTHAVYWDMYNGFNNTYGNICENIRGAGVAMGNSGHMYICDNLFISCKYTVTGICGVYHDAFFGDPARHSGVTLNGYMYNDTWKENYPEISEIITNTKDAVGNDTASWFAPVDITIKDNFSYGDRSNCDYRGVMSLNLNSERNGHFERLNPGTIVDTTADNGSLIIFNSRREGMPEIKEALETASAFVDITYEQFLEMGTDWTPVE